MSRVTASHNCRLFAGAAAAGLVAFLALAPPSQAGPLAPLPLGTMLRVTPRTSLPGRIFRLCNPWPWGQRWIVTRIATAPVSRASVDVHGRPTIRLELCKRDTHGCARRPKLNLGVKWSQVQGADGGLYNVRRPSLGFGSVDDAPSCHALFDHAQFQARVQNQLDRLSETLHRRQLFRRRGCGAGERCFGEPCCVGGGTFSLPTLCVAAVTSTARKIPNVLRVVVPHYRELNGVTDDAA